MHHNTHAHADKQVPRLREMYDEMAAALSEHMVQKTSPSKLWYFAEIANANSPTQINAKVAQQYLPCVWAGWIAFECFSWAVSGDVCSIKTR